MNVKDLIEMLKETEDNVWYLCTGILMGMVLCFWFCPDIEFFRTVWPVIMAFLIAWAIVSALIRWWRRKHGK